MYMGIRGETRRPFCEFADFTTNKKALSKKSKEDYAKRAKLKCRAESIEKKRDFLKKRLERI